MSSALEGELTIVLGGGAVPLPETYDVAPESPKPLRLRHSICYIVMGVLLNERDEVLMMQEAKPECRGSWYLPAGRLEKGETLVEGLCREVTEETGLTCEPITLLAVEERGTAWIRFVFLARQTGGSLKSELSADSESLQASWWDTVSSLPLRCRDIVPHIKLAMEYQKLPSHPSVLPQVFASPHLALRLVLLCFGSEGQVWVLQSVVHSHGLPVILCSTSRSSFLNSLRCLLKDPPRSCGILGLHHQGGEGADGVCFNIMAEVSTNEPPSVPGEGFRWALIKEEELRGQLESTVKEKTLLPLYS
ncbi:8-oxo-dGDP phosphatase NUDT18 [Xenopus laevis]|uniref:8-oxo-dGDP phosphatase NUDT18 n=2 Tax=Xenopus laevis TaxID=8355 RepID=A0A1L8GRQ2_XENLA|nr:8-oxo-dGDP phosphatase NUDT18 [Xenopus laevis]XP_018110538.1 8-oxo-dGDP phosphatase NUDT18 [Xenopus laevis]OCT86510.1 hypothetical protein XELAEV_18020195mg [Xenopus laevis]